MEGSSTVPGADALSSTDSCVCELTISSGFSQAHGKSASESSSDASDCSTEEEDNNPHVPASKTNKEKRSDKDRMFERFAQLLLGEDMSGGRNGVSTALAISNAITNLSVSVFENLLKLEPVEPSKKKLWRREMGWLVSVTDHIVELVPRSDQFRNSTSSVEVMERRPRPDLQMNLPALRKLDAMIFECLESFKSAEFWYVDEKHMVCSKEKAKQWWLPVPRVPPAGLSEESRKALVQQKESTNQIFKAAMAINAQVLSEMEVPDLYLEGLPKNGRAVLGDLYRGLTSDDFSPDAVLSRLDLSNEHNTVGLANHIEAAIHVWQNKLQNKQVHQPASKENKFNARNSWVMVKEFVADAEKKEVLVERAESLLLSLRQRCPGLPQTTLDMQKIQYNKDVGQAILESYSRVLESLAFNIIARIDAVLSADEAARSSFLATPPDSSSLFSSSKQSSDLSSLTKEPSRKSSGQRVTENPLYSPGRTLGDHIKLEHLTKPLYMDVDVKQQWACHLENSPLARD